MNTKKTNKQGILKTKINNKAKLIIEALKILNK